MIIVLLLFFQSICLYCQRLVLYIHDRWINPKNVRLLKEADELPQIVRKQQLEAEETDRILQAKRARKRYTQETYDALTTDSIVLAERCRFCANCPQGYCRHHFHLQELHLQQKQQQEQRQRSWANPLGADKTQDYRQLRKINRQLKQNLKNRLNAQQQQQQPQQYYHFYQPQQFEQQQQPPITKTNAPFCSSSSSCFISAAERATALNTYPAAGAAAAPYLAEMLLSGDSADVSLAPTTPTTIASLASSETTGSCSTNSTSLATSRL